MEGGRLRSLQEATEVGPGGHQDRGDDPPRATGALQGPGGSQTNGRAKGARGPVWIGSCLSQCRYVHVYIYIYVCMFERGFKAMAWEQLQQLRRPCVRCRRKHGRSRRRANPKALRCSTECCDRHPLSPKPHCGSLRRSSPRSPNRWCGNRPSSRGCRCAPGLSCYSHSSYFEIF